MDIKTEYEMQLCNLLNHMTPEMIGIDLDDNSEEEINITEASKIFELFQVAVGAEVQHNANLKAYLRQGNLIDLNGRFYDDGFVIYIKSKILQPKIIEQGLQDDDDSFVSFCRILLPILVMIYPERREYADITDPYIVEASDDDFDTDTVEATSSRDDMECILPGASREIFIDEEGLKPEVLSIIDYCLSSFLQ